MERVCDSFRNLYLVYDLYTKSCEKQGKIPVGFLRLLCNSLIGK